MKTQVTKKKLTLRTQKAEPVAPAEEEASAPVAAPQVAAFRPHVSDAYHKPAMIAAILACLVFLGLIAIQIIEWTYYQSPPSVWPPKLM
jgi:hypothetical protein